jgi:hypothetical protein
MRRLALILLIAACDSGGKGSGHDAAIDTPHPIDSPVAIDAPMIDGPPGTTPLTVKNYLNWCSVTVNGGTASTAASQLVNVTPGSIPLVAKVASAAFEISGNMWHHTSGDTGAGEPGTVTGTGAATQSAATITVGATAACVWVCCPFVGGTGCTGLAEQCP